MKTKTWHFPLLISMGTTIVISILLAITITIASPTALPPAGNPTFPLVGPTGAQGTQGAQGPAGPVGPAGPAAILSTSLVVVECAGSCANKPTPNTICTNRFGAGWKALNVDCECIEDPTGVTSYRTRSFDQNPDWCCDTGGEDMVVTCYNT